MPEPGRVRRRLVPDLSAAFFPTAPVVPLVEAVHERGMLEIFRGCTRGCRFCQAGMIYLAIGIIGATVMPHNLYLHSALVQTRRLGKDERSIRRGVGHLPFLDTVSCGDLPSRRSRIRPEKLAMFG